jgi:ABC-2 type transport system permease protein
MTAIAGFAPASGAAERAGMLRAQARMELRVLLRNGEQVGLTLVVPLLLELFFDLPGATPGTARIDDVVPNMIALAVLSSAFTGLAIGTGFERKYGVLKRLGATALPRSTLLLGKLLAVLALQALQVVLVCALGVVLGWRPHGDPAPAVALILCATIAFAGLGFLVAGTLRAEVTLAAANLVWLALLFGGGIAIPLDRYPSWFADAARVLPSAALSDGLRQAFQLGVLSARDGLTLLVWAALAVPAAARWFRWE